MVGVVAGLVVCLVLVVVALGALRRQRRQIAALMARLDVVEAREAETAAVVASDERQARSDEPGAELGAPSGDVLAGHTSYVEAMVENASNEAMSLADRVIVAIHANLDRALTPRDLAAELGVSLRTVERVLAATLECTPSRLIAAMKMRAARRLLASGQYRVNEVAYRLGFSSPAHFSTRFKSFYRVPPSLLLPQHRDPNQRRSGDDHRGQVN